MGDVLDLEFGDASLIFSILVWFKTTDTGGYLVSKMDGTPTGYGIYVGASGQLHARLFSDATYQEEIETTSTGWNDGEWHQAVWAYSEPGSGAGSSLYIDGELQTVTVVSDNVLGQPTANAAELNFAGRNNGSDLLACRFTDIAVYSKALNAVDVSRLYNSGNCLDLKILDTGSSLVGYWRVDYSSSRILPLVGDYARNQYNGTPVNMSTSDISLDTPGGASTESLSFNGTTQYVGMGNVLGYDRTSVFSMSCWFKSTQAGRGSILGKHTYTGYAIRLETGKIYVLFANNWTSTSWMAVQTPLTYNDGVWHHVLVTYTGSSNVAGITVYIDGAVIAMTTVRDTLTSAITTTEPFQLGYGGYATNGSRVYYEGLLDEVALWSGIALTAPEVAAVYNAGSPPDLRTLSTAFALSAYWPIGGEMRLEDSALYPNVVAAAGIGVGSENIPCEIDPLQYMLGTSLTWDMLARYPGPGGVAPWSMQYLASIGGHIMGYVPAPTTFVPFSAGAWFKLESASPLGQLLGRCTGSGTSLNGWAIQQRYGAIAFSVRSYTDLPRLQIYTNATYVDGLWHHVICTWNGSGTQAGMTIYIDGVAVAVTSGMNYAGSGGIDSRPYSTGCSGASVSSSYNMIGKLTECAEWNICFSALQVTEAYNAGVPIRYTDLSTAGNLLKYHRLGNTAETPPAATLNTLLDIVSTDAPGGVLTRSIRCDVAAFTLSLGNSFNWQRNQSFSLSGWFKTSASLIEQTIIAKEDATRRGYLAFITATGEIEWSIANTATNRVSVRTTATFNDGNWHHLVVTYGGASLATSLAIYVDGAVQATTTILDALTADTYDDAALYFGSTARTSATLRGLLAGPAMYIGQLDAVEVAEVYNGGVPADPETLTTAAELLGYWPIGEGYHPGTLVGMAQANLVADYPFFSDLTTEKTWVTEANYVLAAGDTTANTTAKLLLDWKNKLCAHGYTVVGSSDGTNYEYEGETAGGSYGGDSTGPYDVWEDYTDVLYKVDSSQGPSGWVLMRSPLSTAGQFWIILWRYASSTTVFRGYVGNTKPPMRTPANEICPFWSAGMPWHYISVNEGVYHASGTSGCRSYLSICENDGSFVFLRQTIATGQYYQGMTAFMVLDENRAPSIGQKSVVYHYIWGTTRDNTRWARFNMYLSGATNLRWNMPLIPCYTGVTSTRAVLQDYYSNYSVYPVWVYAGPQDATYDTYFGNQLLMGPIPDMFIAQDATPNGSCAPEKPPYRYVCVEGMFWVPGDTEPVFA
jgi:hypothetical protein